MNGMKCADVFRCDGTDVVVRRIDISVGEG